MADEILLIDPDKGYADALATYLERRRFEVFFADSIDNVRTLLDSLVFFPDIILITGQPARTITCSILLPSLVSSGSIFLV